MCQYAVTTAYVCVQSRPRRPCAAWRGTRWWRATWLWAASPARENPPLTTSGPRPRPRPRSFSPQCKVSTSEWKSTQTLCAPTFKINRTKVYKMSFLEGSRWLQLSDFLRVIVYIRTFWRAKRLSFHFPSKEGSPTTLLAKWNLEMSLLLI